MEKPQERNASYILNQIKNKNGVKSPKTESKPSLQLGSSIEAKISIDTFENAKVTEKKATASVWLAKQFPLKFQVNLFNILLILVESASNYSIFGQWELHA